MKLNLLILCLVFQFSAIAQNDFYHTNFLNQLQNQYGLTGGNWVFTSNDNTNIQSAISYNVLVTKSSITGQDFDQKVALNVTNPVTNPWDAGYFIKNTNAIQQGDKVLMAVWLRSDNSTGTPSKLSIFAEDAVTYHKEIYITTTLDTLWKQYLIPFESSENYPIGDLNVGFHLGYQQQNLEYGGMTMINYGNTVALQNLPHVLNIENYSGAAANAPWRAAAANRIDQHRKANMNIQVIDQQGNPLSNVPVRIEMVRHQFAFGSAVTPRRLANNSGFDATYQSKILDLDGNGHGFNWVVTENALKWDAWEGNFVSTPTETVNAINFLTNHQIKVRGHVLVWPGWNVMPSDMQAHSNDPNYLINRINGRLNTMLNYPGIKGKVKEWDVINEIVHVRDLEYALQGTAGYTTGREFYPQIFNQTQQEDPTVIKYINDYNILNNGSVIGGDYLLYKSFIQEIIDAGAPLDGIGLQAHMGGALVAIDSLYAILDDCYQTFGKDIKITEYDMSDNIPDSLAAQYTGDFLTMIFSHPATNGFLMWGFWDGAHWLGNAPLYYQNWQPKPTHGVFTDLVFNQWWTDSTLTTDANGHLSIRGFEGDYKITATLNSTDVIAHLELHDDVNTTVQLFAVNAPQVLNEVDFKIFPNPTSDILNIKLPHSDDWTIQLYNEIGQLMLEQHTNNLDVNIGMQGFTTGAYVLKIINSKSEVISKKVLVK